MTACNASSWTARTRRVHSVSVGMTQASFVLDGKKLRIELPWRYSRGRTFLLAIEYVSTPQQGIYFTGPDEGYPDKPIQIWTQGQDTDNHHWFPCIDEPKGRLTSEIVATVPSSWTVISNGRLISDRRNREDGTRTVRWLQDKKHAVYLITLVAGEFSRVVQQEEGPLIDFYCEPGREEDAGRAFENTSAMIALIRRRFRGKVPVGQVHAGRCAGLYFRRNGKHLGDHADRLDPARRTGPPRLLVGFPGRP